jgi:TRAP-type C4-dicarboxylate transport system permease small subunit
MKHRTENPLKILYNGISNSFRYLAVACLMIMIFVTLLQVIMRTWFSIPMVGVEEMARYLLICVVFISLPLVVREEGHIRMDELQRFLPVRIRGVIRPIILFSAVISFGFIAVAAVITTIKNLDNMTPTLGLPFVVFFLPTILGFSLMVIEYAFFFIYLVKKERNKVEITNTKIVDQDRQLGKQS